MVKNFALTIGDISTSLTTTTTTLTTSSNEKLLELELTFSDVLFIIGLISLQIGSLTSLTSSSSSLLNNSEQSVSRSKYDPGLHTIIQTMSEFYLIEALQRWTTIDNNNNNLNNEEENQYFPTQVSNFQQLSPLFLEINSIFWLCRQSSLIHTLDDIFHIYEAIVSTSSTK